MSFCYSHDGKMCKNIKKMMVKCTKIEKRHVKMHKKKTWMEKCEKIEKMMVTCLEKKKNLNGKIRKMMIVEW